ncbi:hypothetical protein [Saccharothrix sp. HUAS TT1]|uniref:hypothetical protein n=1 Tax=unclassified Saccharothrix TaxID=2593673 RepID=UPI00345BB6A8
MTQPSVTIGEFNANISRKLGSVYHSGEALPITNSRHPGDYVVVAPTWLWNAMVDALGGPDGLRELREQHQLALDVHGQERAA